MELPGSAVVDASVERPPSSTASPAWLCLPLLLLAAACGPGAADEGYILLDPQARQAGFVLEVDGEARSTPLPIAVTVGDGMLPVLAGPERREALEVAAGELIYVRGPEGAIEQGAPDRDKLRIRSDEASARAFAARMGMTPAADGPARWKLEGHDALPMAALFTDADATTLFSSAPFFLAGEPERRVDPGLVDARSAAQAAGDAASGDGFVWKGPHAEDEALADFFAAQANGTARRSPEELERDRAEIVRDLEITLTLDGPRVFRSGQDFRTRVSLVNRGVLERWVVRPRDGSEMGWREPYVFYRVEHEASPGVWVEVPKESYSRCGNYEIDWGKDVVVLPPGGSLPLTAEILPATHGSDLHAAGRYRMTAHYDYRGGAGRRSAFSSGLSNLVPEELEGMPAFEVVSAPLEFEIVRPYDVVMKLKGPLVIGPSTTVTSLFDVSLVNRSGEALALPSHEDDHGLFVQIETVSGEYLWSWYSSTDNPRLSFASGGQVNPRGRVSLLEGVEAVMGEGHPAASNGPVMARIRAGVWLGSHQDSRRMGVRSGWIEAPIEWVARPSR